jgi:dGTPase
MAGGLYARLVPEAKPTRRSEAARDHDCILSTSAVQRLAGITQVAASEPGISIHNRLTHTLKVAQVARRIAEKLNLSVDRREVAAAAALAHTISVIRHSVIWRRWC